MEFLRRAAAQSIGIGGVGRCLSGGGGVRSTYLKTDRSRLFPSDRVVAQENFTQTRSYAALRAADLDWIVGPGYSLGRVHSGEKP